jgi:ankyrin repeat protein
MIQEAINIQKIKPGEGFELLEEVLKDLKNGNTTTINKQGKDNATALYYAADLRKLDIVQALLSRNADPDLVDSYSWSPLHIAILRKSFDIALLLLSSNKISKANLEAAVMNNNSATALAYAQEKAANGDASQKANWQAIVNALQAAEATK